jgi:prevent-host-death family protein
MNVGIRELKARLSEYVERASGGDDIVVTDRGRPVARLVAFAQSSAVQRGIDEGWIEAPRRTSLTEPTRYSSASSVLAALDEDRG